MMMERRMIVRAMLGLFMGLIAFSCNQQGSKDGLETKDGSETHSKLKTGLKIEYKPTRGQSYTDTLGTGYQLRHIPVMITNDSTVSIHVQFAFSTAYDYPTAYNDKQFNIFPMPKVWALDGVDITDQMLNELTKYIDKPELQKTLEPGEEWRLAFGTRYPRKINYGVFPVAIFSQDNRELNHECKQLIDPGQRSISHSALELLIGFTSGSQASPDSCIIFPCGQMSYRTFD